MHTYNELIVGQRRSRDFTRTLSPGEFAADATSVDDSVNGMAGLVPELID